MPSVPEIVVVPLSTPRVDQQAVEIVERKGLGHPDTLCDQAAEALSRALSREYLARTGRIQHHNVDKALLSAGVTEVTFGGGRVIQPMRLIHGGRATTDLGGVRLAIPELAASSARETFRKALRHLDPLHDLEVEALIRTTSRELAALFSSQSGVALANDTSVGTGYAPFSQTERLVMALSHHLEAPETLKRHPYLGEDVKILAVRKEKDIRVTVAAAFVAAHVRSLADYLEAKTALAATLLDRGREVSEMLQAVQVNTADDPAAGGVYLTVTGTSAEAGDDGQVGRGNRASGLITPARPMTLEALAGKNPVSHVGKLYNLWAQRLACHLVELPGIDYVDCQLASQIGLPIDQPQIVAVAAAGAAAGNTAIIRAKVAEELKSIPELWRELVRGNWMLF